MPIRSTALMAGLGLGALLLTGCASGTPAPEPTSAAPQVTSEAPEPTPTETAKPAPASTSSGELTEPGTVLAFGDAAFVSWHHHSGEDIDLKVEVLSAKQAPLEEILAVVSDSTAAQIEGYTAYYVNVSFTKTNLSQGAIEFSDATSPIFATNSSGAEVPELTLFGSFEPCDYESFDTTVDEGAPQLTCMIFMVPGGQTFGGVAWGEFDTPYDKYNGSPIHWK